MEFRVCYTCIFLEHKFGVNAFLFGGFGFGVKAPKVIPLYQPKMVYSVAYSVQETAVYLLCRILLWKRKVYD